MAHFDLNQRTSQTQDSQISLQRRHRRRCLIDCGQHSRTRRRGPERIERTTDRLESHTQVIRHDNHPPRL
jgi:hypothetical protein